MPDHATQRLIYRAERLVHVKLLAESGLLRIKELDDSLQVDIVLVGERDRHNEHNSAQVITEINSLA